MELNQWFDKGLTIKEYTDLLDKHKENFNHIYHNFTLPNDQSFFNNLKKKNLRVLVLAEVWCGHCMLNIPILVNLAEKIDMPVRFLNRDENLTLMDQYLTNGNRTIPIFIFIDEDGNEVAQWGPMAPKTKEFLAPYRNNMPAKDDEQYEEKFKEMVQMTTKEFRENRDIWNGVYQSIKETLV